ncbi:hypothetical protein FQY83_11330 [Luteimonas marina]|uniref:Uncharacterized protein n=1 Tax=Luteimonas marina TaxID=488485 RepID=A0A5C5U347_9GAMM|nr:hypothetical protein [Luteimonas marina]TWT20314.1 hypothetical protein FQY83_11330 [Luteimonas marina]
MPQQAARADAICAWPFNQDGKNTDPCAEGLNRDRASNALGIRLAAAHDNRTMAGFKDGAALAARY